MIYGTIVIHAWKIALQDALNKCSVPITMHEATTISRTLDPEQRGVDTILLLNHMGIK